MRDNPDVPGRKGWTEEEKDQYYAARAEGMTATSRPTNGVSMRVPLGVSKATTQRPVTGTTLKRPLGVSKAIKTAESGVGKPQVYAPTEFDFVPERADNSLMGRILSELTDQQQEAQQHAQERQANAIMGLPSLSQGGVSQMGITSQAIVPVAAKGASLAASPAMALLQGFDAAWENVIAEPAATALLALNPRNPVFEDGFQPGDVFGMWSAAREAANEASFGVAVMSNPLLRSVPGIGALFGLEDMLFPQMRAVNPFKAEEVREAQQTLLAYNALTGLQDFGLNMIPIPGGKGVSAVRRMTGLSNKVREADRAVLSHDWAMHQQWLASGGTEGYETAIGKQIMEIADSSDVGYIIERPLVENQSGISKGMLADLYANTSDPETVYNVFQASIGDTKAMENLLTIAPDYVYSMGNVSEGIGAIVRDGKFLPPEPARIALDAAFKSAVERQEWSRKLYATFINDVKDETGKVVSTYGNFGSWMPFNGEGRVFTAVTKPIANLAEDMRTSSADMRAALKTGNEEYLPSIAEKVIQTTKNGPVLRLVSIRPGSLQWSFANRPLNIVSFSGSRPDDVLEEAYAIMNQVDGLRMNQQIAVDVNRVNGKSEKVYESAVSFRARQIARITAAMSFGEGAVLEAFRSLEDDIIKAFGHEHDVKADDMDRIIEGMRDKADASFESLKTNGYFFNGAGERVEMNPVTVRQLANSYYTMPINEIEAAVKTLGNKGLTVGYNIADGGRSLFEIGQQLFRTNMLLKPGYTFRNSILEPWITSLISHMGLLMTPEGINHMMTGFTNFNKNNVRRLRRVTAGTVDARKAAKLSKKHQELAKEAADIMLARDKVIKAIEDGNFVDLPTHKIKMAEYQDQLNLLNHMLSIVAKDMEDTGLIRSDILMRTPTLHRVKTEVDDMLDVANDPLNSDAIDRMERELRASAFSNKDDADATLDLSTQLDDINTDALRYEPFDIDPFDPDSPSIKSGPAIVMTDEDKAIAADWGFHPDSYEAPIVAIKQRLFGRADFSVAGSGTYTREGVMLANVVEEMRVNPNFATEVALSRLYNLDSTPPETKALLERLGVQPHENLIKYANDRDVLWERHDALAAELNRRMAAVNDAFASGDVYAAYGDALFHGGALPEELSDVPVNTYQNIENLHGLGLYTTVNGGVALGYTGGVNQFLHGNKGLYWMPFDDDMRAAFLNLDDRSPEALQIIKEINDNMMALFHERFDGGRVDWDGGFSTVTPGTNLGDDWIRNNLDFDGIGGMRKKMLEHYRGAVSRVMESRLINSNDEIREAVRQGDVEMHELLDPNVVAFGALSSDAERAILEARKQFEYEVQMLWVDGTRQAGYKGITHEGGHIVGGGRNPHQVYIWYDAPQGVQPVNNFRGDFKTMNQLRRAMNNVEAAAHKAVDNLSLAHRITPYDAPFLTKIDELSTDELFALRNALAESNVKRLRYVDAQGRARTIKAMSKGDAYKYARLDTMKAVEQTMLGTDAQKRTDLLATIKALRNRTRATAKKGKFALDDQGYYDELNSLNRELDDVSERMAALRGEQAVIKDRRDKRARPILQGEGETTRTLVDGQQVTASQAFAGVMGPAYRADASSTVTNVQGLSASAHHTTMLNMALSRMRMGKSGTVRVTDPHYFEELHYTATQHFAGDAFFDMIATQPRKKVEAWVNSREGKRYFKALGVNGKKYAKNLDEAYYVYNSLFPTVEAQRLVSSGEQFTVGELQAALLRPGPDGQAAKLGDIVGNEIDYVVPTSVFHQAGNLYQKALDRIWDYIATQPETRMARWPWYVRQFDQELTARMNVLAAQGITIDVATANGLRKAAHRSTLEELEKTFYNIRRYKNPVFTSRFLMAFPGAYFNSIYRYAYRLPTRYPGNQATVMNMTNSLFNAYAVDEKGNKTTFRDGTYILLPGTGEYPDPKTGLTHDPGIRIPIDAVTRVFLDNPGRSWVIAMTADSVLNMRPELDQWLDTTFRDSFPGGGMIADFIRTEYGPQPGDPIDVMSNSLLTGWQKTLIQWWRGEGSEQYRQDFGFAWQHAQAEHLRTGNTAPVTRDEVHDLVNKWYSLRTLVQWASPMSYKVDAPGQLERDTWFRIREENPDLSFDDQRQKYYEILGGGAQDPLSAGEDTTFWAAPYTVSTSKDTFGINANYSPEAITAITDNSELAATLGSVDSELVGLLAVGAGGSFNRAAYNKMALTKPYESATESLRGKKYEQDYFTDWESTQAWDEWSISKTRYIATRKAAVASGNSAYVRALDDSWDDYRQDIEGRYPQWALKKQMMPAQKTEAIAGALTMMRKNDKFMSGRGKDEDWAAVWQFLDDRQKLKTILSGLGSTDEEDAYKKTVKADFMAYYADKSLENPLLMDLWDRYFAGELEDN